MPRPLPGTPAAKPTLVPRTRYPSGDQRPPAEVARAPTLVRRILDHGIALGMDARLATQLGQLLLRGEITESECQAGFMYAEDCGRFAKIKGIPPRSARSPSWDGGFKGDKGLDLTALAKMDAEVAAKIEKKIKRQNEAIEKNYKEAMRCVPLSPRYLRDHLDALCCEDQRIEAIYLHDVRKVLRVLAKRRYQVNDAVKPRETEAQRKKRLNAANKAVIAVDSLERVFADLKVKIVAFDLSMQGEKTRSITGYGFDGADRVSRTVEISLRGVIGAVLDAQLLKVAVSRGWAEAPKGEAA